MKKFISAFLSIFILLVLNFYLAKFLKLPFLQLSFMTGLISTIAIGFFSSEGGFTTELSNVRFKHLLHKDSRTNTHFTDFHINIPFIVSLLYTFISAIFSLIAYWKYF